MSIGIMFHNYSRLDQNSEINKLSQVCWLSMLSGMLCGLSDNKANSAESLSLAKVSKFKISQLFRKSIHVVIFKDTLGNHSIKEARQS